MEGDIVRRWLWGVCDEPWRTLDLQVTSNYQSLGLVRRLEQKDARMSADARVCRNQENWQPTPIGRKVAVSVDFTRYGSYAGSLPKLRPKRWRCGGPLLSSRYCYFM